MADMSVRESIFTYSSDNCYAVQERSRERPKRLELFGVQFSCQWQGPSFQSNVVHYTDDLQENNCIVNAPINDPRKSDLICAFGERLIPGIHGGLILCVQLFLTIILQLQAQDTHCVEFYRKAKTWEVEGFGEANQPLAGKRFLCMY